jgi:hypothetical protein
MKTSAEALTVPCSAPSDEHAWGAIEECLGLRTIASAVCLTSGVLAAVSCIGYSTTGEITGEMVVLGGRDVRYVSGIVRAIGDDGEVFEVRVPRAAGGAFTLSLEEGRYRISGSTPLHGSPQQDCEADPPEIQILAGSTQPIVVVCPSL